MRLSAYLDRIGYDGPVAPDLATLQGVHRAHLLAVPYENLDVQLGRTLTTSVDAAYEKIVSQRRGGWCYEMNGLLGWALSEIGFETRRLATGPLQPYSAEPQLGNHLVIRVDLAGETWLSDVGFGDGPLAPYRCVEGEFDDRGFTYRLDKLADGWWRLNNHPLGLSPNYHARLDLSDEALLSERCTWLNTSPDSMFVNNAVVLRHSPKGHMSLIGRKHRTLTSEGRTSRLIEDADDYLATLKTEFALDLPQAASLWPKICARHEELFANPSP